MKLVLFLAAALIIGCSHDQSWYRDLANYKSNKKRGPITKHDQGPPKGSKWPDLFAETPNYRAFGKAVLGGRGEKFRWKFGPMFYRGRLQPNKVKVFIIGQEGAQDENVSNRSFTGSTGTRMQKFLNHLGIYESYLFMNTFVYTITGQYTSEDPAMMWLAQNKDSVVVKHRHKMFDYMLDQNDGTLALVIGVGRAGKDSAATWVESHGGKCSSIELSRGYCEGKGKLKGVKVIGVKHPGGANPRLGGESAAAALRADFSNKAYMVGQWIKENSRWLKQDVKKSIPKTFKYGYAPIPHQDFAFGTNWKMGAYATTSNRRGSDAIQIFSDKGCYNNAKRDSNGRCGTSVHKISYLKPKDESGKPREMKSGEVSYEPPQHKTNRRNYDEGPSSSFAKLLMGFWDHDYESMGVKSHGSFGPNGMYRGRLDGAKVLVLADQHSHDDMFSGRALTGSGGQKLQTFLKSVGLTKSYMILRTLPVDTVDLSTEKMVKIATNKEVTVSRDKVINKILREGDIGAVLAIGPGAQAVAKEFNFKSTPVFEMAMAKSSSHVSNWKSIASKVKKLGLSTDKKPSGTYTGKVSIIPRLDLPWGTRWWMGTSGDRAVRAYEGSSSKKKWNPHYYKVHSPSWSNKSKADISSLTSAEKASAAKFKR